MRFLSSLVLLLCVLGSHGRLVSYCKDFKPLNGGSVVASGLIGLFIGEGVSVEGAVRIIPAENYTVSGHMDTCLNSGGELWMSNSTGSNLTLVSDSEMMYHQYDVMDYGFDEELKSLVFYNANNAKSICCDLVNYYDLDLQLVSVVHTDEVNAALFQDTVDGIELVLALVSGSNSTSDSVDLVLGEGGCTGSGSIKNAEILNITRPGKEHYYTVAMEISGVSSKTSLTVPEASICEEFQVVGEGSLPPVPTEASPTAAPPVETGNPNYISSASGIVLSIVSALVAIVVAL